MRLSASFPGSVAEAEARLEHKYECFSFNKRLRGGARLNLKPPRALTIFANLPLEPAIAGDWYEAPQQHVSTTLGVCANVPPLYGFPVARNRGLQRGLLQDRSLILYNFTCHRGGRLRVERRSVQTA